MTDRMLYIFILGENKCSCCPEEFFCPDSPILEFKLEYKHIQVVSIFEGGQRIAFKSNELKKLNSTY